MNISAVLALVVVGAVLGLMLGIANQYLHVEEDNRISVVEDMLPSANCGGCGFPGCAGFANALVDGEATSVSACLVCDQEAKEKIVNYLNSTPGPDGKALKVNI